MPKLTRWLPALACAVIASLPMKHAQAGLFDSLNDLKNKLTESRNQADAKQDAAYEDELAKKFPPYGFDQPANAQAPQYIEVARGAGMKDVRKVGIVNFSVEFALFKEVEASGGGMSSGAATTTGRSMQKTMRIPAPEVAKLQAMVDQLYGDTVRDFQSMGIEVLPFETIRATKHYAELAPAQHASPWTTDTKDSQSVFIAPTGMPLYMDNPNRADFLKGVGFTFGTNTRMKEVMMTYDLNREVHLLSVNMVVDFAALKSSGRSFLSYASVGAANMHHLHAENTVYRFISTTNPQFMLATLKKPLVSDVRLISTTTATRGETSTQSHSAIGLQTQTTSGDTAVRGEGEFDQTTYYRRSADMLGAARQMFAAELARQR